MRRQKHSDKGLRVLATVQLDQLDSEQKALHEALITEAHRAKESGALEFADDSEDERW
ncbi:MAG: hypothetical protein AAF581_12145 [Planctomycetota bacterium]